MDFLNFAVPKIKSSYARVKHLNPVPPFFKYWNERFLTALLFAITIVLVWKLGVYLRNEYTYFIDPSRLAVSTFNTNKNGETDFAGNEPARGSDKKNRLTHLLITLEYKGNGHDSMTAKLWFQRPAARPGQIYMIKTSKQMTIDSSEVNIERSEIARTRREHRFSIPSSEIDPPIHRFTGNMFSTEGSEVTLKFETRHLSSSLYNQRFPTTIIVRGLEALDITSVTPAPYFRNLDEVRFFSPDGSKFRTNLVQIRGTDRRKDFKHQYNLFFLGLGFGLITSILAPILLDLVLYIDAYISGKPKQ